MDLSISYIKYESNVKWIIRNILKLYYTKWLIHWKFKLNVLIINYIYILWKLRFIKLTSIMSKFIWWYT